MRVRKLQWAEELKETSDLSDGERSERDMQPSQEE